jgi:hypothetical protein
VLMEQTCLLLLVPLLSRGVRLMGQQQIEQ